VHGGRTAFVSPFGWNDGNDAFTPEYEFSPRGFAGIPREVARVPEPTAGFWTVCVSAYFFVGFFFFPPAGFFFTAVVFFPPLDCLGGALAAVFFTGAFFIAAGVFGD